MTARRELVWFYDLAGDRVAATRHDILDIWTDERFGQSEQFGFTLPADHPKAGYVVVDAELRHRGRQYFVTEVEVRRDDAAAVIAVEADATWYRLGDNPYVGTFLADDVTTLAGIEQILAGTGWTADAEATSTSSTTFSMELDDRSRLELLRGWAKVTGTYLKFSTTRKQVALAAAPGIDSNISFRYARNLLGARKRTRPPELTRVYPYGADGLSVAGINGGLPYVEDLSYYTDQGLTDDQAARLARGRVWSDPAFIREADLLSAATAYLAARSSPEVSYELKVVDLAEVTEITERARIGDTVRVYDPEIAAGGLRPIVTRFRRHWLEPWRNEIELSTILDPLGDLTSSNGRPSSSDEWQQFTGPIRAEYRIRNDATYTVARIPLRFREGGRANYHLDFQATGVGAGTMLVEVSDANNADEVKFRDVSIDYTDGQTVTVALDWAAEELAGAYNYRLRVTTVADGGPSTSAGVNILADADTPEQEASFYIMAQGAVQETPTAANSETFTFTGAVQSFTVPDNVDELTITANGAPGGGATRGLGGRVTATVPVTPGADLDVYVGGKGGESGGGGGPFPNGGGGGSGSGGNDGFSGGGSSDVRPAGGGMADALVVAGGGGGSGEDTDAAGGDGGFFEGSAGTSPEVLFDAFGLGGTQFAGGAGGAGAAGGGPGEAGDTDGRGQGGDAPNTSSGIFFPPGGGGGGWHGGGGGGQDSFTGPGAAKSGGGGGGSGHVVADGYDLELGDGVHDDDGTVVISWETPLIE